MAVKNVFRILDFFIQNPDKAYSVNMIRTILDIDVKTIKQVILFSKERGWLEEISGKIKKYKWVIKNGN